MPSSKTIARLSLYRRVLNRLLEQGKSNVFSHQLAQHVRGTAAQVRRDVMAIGYSGSPTRGYDIEQLIQSIGSFLDDPAGQAVALVGIGNLGRALLAYFSGRRPRLSIVAAFDTDPAKVNRVIQGCRCYPTDKLAEVCRDKHITVGINAVPAGAAQETAEAMVEAGIVGILNFAPIPLQLPDEIAVEDMDMTTALEMVAYLARQKSRKG
ncbi:MAG: redox-sensing transcriptional repressor Rex [Planctomycetota bacterium]